jgi:hypothetical protein
MVHLNCILKSHELYIKKHVTHHVKEYACKHCDAKFTTSSKGTLIPLTAQRREVNALLEHIYKKRTKRRLNKEYQSS